MVHASGDSSSDCKPSIDNGAQETKFKVIHMDVFFDFFCAAWQGSVVDVDENIAPEYVEEGEANDVWVKDFVEFVLQQGFLQ